MKEGMKVIVPSSIEGEPTLQLVLSMCIRSGVEPSICEDLVENLASHLALAPADGRDVTGTLMLELISNRDHHSIWHTRDFGMLVVDGYTPIAFAFDHEYAVLARPTELRVKALRRDEDAASIIADALH